MSNNGNRKRKEEKKLSTTAITNIVVFLLIVGIFVYFYVSKEMEIKRVESYKQGAASALKLTQNALDTRDSYNVYNKGWGYFLGAEFCNPPLGMDRDMLAYGVTTSDPRNPRSLASYLICPPDKGVTPPVLTATGGCGNSIFQTKEGMIFSHMNSSATKWDRVFYVDTNGGAGPTNSITSYRKKLCSLNGGYGNTSGFTDETGYSHEKCAPNNTKNEHPDVICLIIRGGNKILPGDERTKKILETGHAIEVKVNGKNGKNGKAKK